MTTDEKFPSKAMLKASAVNYAVLPYTTAAKSLYCLQTVWGGKILSAYKDTMELKFNDKQREQTKEVAEQWLKNCFKRKELHLQF